MLGWFKLVGLRMQALAVVELEYRMKLDVAGGPHTQVFNAATRKTRDLGGNEYDAAAKFITDWTRQLHEQGGDAMDFFVPHSKTGLGLMPRMRTPYIFSDDVDALMDELEHPPQFMNAR